VPPQLHCQGLNARPRRRFGDAGSVVGIVRLGASVRGETAARERANARLIVDTI